MLQQKFQYSNWIFYCVCDNSYCSITISLFVSIYIGVNLNVLTFRCFTVARKKRGKQKEIAKLGSLKKKKIRLTSMNTNKGIHAPFILTAIFFHFSLIHSHSLSLSFTTQSLSVCLSLSLSLSLSHSLTLTHTHCFSLSTLGKNLAFTQVKKYHCSVNRTRAFLMFHFYFCFEY